MNYWTQNAQNIYVAGHRGWPARYPENTLESFQAAIELGVDQIETDIRMSYDGELVLFHDETVDRVTNGTGRVATKTLAELQALKFRTDKDGTAYVPTLREFLTLAAQYPMLTLDIELKVYPTPGNEETSFQVCDRTIAMLDEMGFRDRYVINSFSGRLNEYVNDKYGKAVRQHVYFPVHDLGRVTRNPYDYAFCCCMFNAFYSDIGMATPEEFAHMASLGVEPWAGTSVKDEPTVDAAIQAGATLITCNNPDVVLDLLRKKGYHK